MGATPTLPPQKPVSANGILRCDLCVIGGGSGGLSVAAGAVQMGASVVLIEKGKMGGDCLNTGCVPSKALIAAAQHARSAQQAANFGIHVAQMTVRFDEVHRHVHAVIGAIAPHDSVERFEGLGVHVIRSHARFIDASTVEAGGQHVKARRFVIATGSRAAVPPVSGLEDAGYLTNESIFDLEELPDHLIVIGGGPIGLEMAQSFQSLGSRVTVIEKFGILARDEPEAVKVVRDALLAQGVVLIEGIGVRKVTRTSSGVEVELDEASPHGKAVAGSHVLVAAGRRSNVEDLGLDTAGVVATPRGITVDDRLRTRNPRIFAIGDAAGGPQFTHIAGYHAGIVIRNALFGLPAKVDYRALPWVTYTSPELAHTGLTEADARKKSLRVQIVSWPFALNDRAQAEQATSGLIKVVLDKRGRILGATIVGEHAGELIGMWALAISSKLRIGAVAATVLPYPTLSEVSKRAAGSYFTPTLFGRLTRMVVRLVQRVFS